MHHFLSPHSSRQCPKCQIHHFPAALQPGSEGSESGDHLWAPKARYEQGPIVTGVRTDILMLDINRQGTGSPAEEEGVGTACLNQHQD